MRRTDPATPPPGFVLPVVLGILLVAGLFASQLAADLGSQRLLATHRLLHQRAFEAAEYGLSQAMQQLRSGIVPPASQHLVLPGHPTDSVQVLHAITAQDALPAGFSTGHVSETFHEIRSTGYSLRGARVTLVQGVRQRQWLAP